MAGLFNPSRERAILLRECRVLIFRGAIDESYISNPFDITCGADELTLEEPFDFFLDL